MAYDDRAANSTQSAETSSPRERARTDQQTAPTRATAPQIAIDFGVIRDGLPPGAAGVRSTMCVDIRLLERLASPERTCTLQTYPGRGCGRNPSRGSLGVRRRKPRAPRRAAWAGAPAVRAAAVRRGTPAHRRGRA